MRDDGWVIVWVREHTDYPTMTTNIADGELARRMADEMVRQGHEIVAVCPAGRLRTLADGAAV